MFKIRDFFSVLILPILLYSSGAFANDKEYKIKAGFLYNFARFGQWEVSLAHNEHFDLCSSSIDFVETASKTLKDRSVKNLPIVIRHVVLNAASLKACNMLFVTADSENALRNVGLASYQHIMLVGEADTFIKNGGQIRFFLSGGKIRFDISPQRLSDAGIIMSSKVLRLARIVEGDK